MLDRFVINSKIFLGGGIWGGFQQARAVLGGGWWKLIKGGGDM